MLLQQDCLSSNGLGFFLPLSIGDPGSCRFYVSVADDLICRFDPALAAKMRKSARPGGELSADFADAIAALQRKAERDNYESRCKLMRQELWLNEVLNTVA